MENPLQESACLSRRNLAGSENLNKNTSPASLFPSFALRKGQNLQNPGTRMFVRSIAPPGIFLWSPFMTPLLCKCGRNGKSIKQLNASTWHVFNLPEVYSQSPETPLYKRSLSSFPMFGRELCHRPVYIQNQQFQLKENYVYTVHEKLKRSWHSKTGLVPVYESKEINRSDEVKNGL